MPPPRVSILVYEERLGVQRSRHGLQLVEDNPTQVDVVYCADEQDHVEVAGHQGHKVHLRDGAQLVAQFAPGILLEFQRDVGGGAEPGREYTRIGSLTSEGVLSKFTALVDPMRAPASVDVFRHQIETVDPEVRLKPKGEQGAEPGHEYPLARR